MANGVWKGYLGAPVNLSKISFFNLRSRSMRKGCLGEAEKKMKKSVRGSKCWGAEVSEDWSIWGPKRQGAEASEVQCLPLRPKNIKELSTISMISVSIKCTISTISGFRNHSIFALSGSRNYTISESVRGPKRRGAEASRGQSLSGPKRLMTEASGAKALEYHDVSLLIKV